ncbi:hypothetical protein SB749_12545 [Brevibacterium sp. SIMBA_078]|uniref:hypothetical protein n=1 Tax=Brevibacterium sp. SIMBA_078 TaxID=3085816 RepID=UPI003979A0B7
MTEYLRVDEEEVRSLGTDLIGSCWWCGGPADSREHKVKRSALKKLWTAEGLDLIQDWNFETKHKLRSPGSNAAMFSRTFCHSCNGARSQPFDRAYDLYWDFINENVDALTSAMFIDLSEIYGEEWEARSQDLGRYAIKSLACRFAEHGVDPPRSWIDFLDGDALRETRIRLGRWEYMSLISRAFRTSNGTSLNCGAGHRGAAWWVNTTRDALAQYEAIDFVNDITTHVTWSADSGLGEVFWDWKVSPLEIEYSTEQQIAHAEVVATRLSEEE